MKTLFKTITMVTALTASAGFNAAAATTFDDIDDAVSASQKLSEARLFPRDIFANRQLIKAIRLSPNGETLAFVTPDKKHAKLWLQDIASGENTLLFTSEMLSNIHWSTDGEYIIMETETGIASAPIDNASSPIFIAALNRSEGDMFNGVDEISPHHVYVSLHSEEDDSFTLYRIDMEGNKTALYSDKNKLTNFYAEANSPIKFMTRASGLTRKLVAIEDGIEREILQCRYNENCGVASYNKKNNVVYMFSREDSDLLNLSALNLTTNKRWTVHTDPEGRFDLNRVRFDSESGDPFLAQYNTDYRENYGIGGDMQAHIDTINAAMGSKVINIDPTSATRWLVTNRNPASPIPSFHLYDLKSKSLSEPLKSFTGGNLPKENSVTAAETAIRLPFWYAADDGFMLQGYLTLPRGVDISTAPMVVYPHGGPWNRIFGSFSSTAQILANRGYIVFEPNFRSSTGFGSNYIQAANRDFGDGRTQDDIINGTNYLLERGIGDKNKLAIFGHSFGGFSTMAALTFTPEMFQVGIAGAPPPSLSKTMAFYVKKQDETRAGIMRVDVMADLAVDINDPEDIARLYAQSPDKNVDKVTKPMYIWAGEKDRKVNILDVRDYAIRLEENGVTVGMLADRNAGHSPRKPIATDAYIYMLETVLAKHLGGRHQPLTNKKLIKYLDKNMIMGQLPKIGG